MAITDTLLARIEDAARTLPKGYVVRIDVENGAGTVKLVRPDDSQMVVDDGESTIAEQFRDACVIAKEEAQEMAALLFPKPAKE